MVTGDFNVKPIPPVINGYYRTPSVNGILTTRRTRNTESGGTRQPTQNRNTSTDP